MSKIRSLLKKPLAAFGQEWNRMAPRERRLVSALAVVILVAMVGVGGFLFSSGLSEIEQRNDDIRDALKAIARNRTEYLEAKQKMRAQEVRIGDTTPQLATDLETAAHEVGVQIAETTERAPTPAGRHYMEHNVDVKLRQVDLQQLGQFLNKLEAGQRLIYVTRLGIRRRFAERNKLDVELTATAIERLQKELPDKKNRGRKRT